MSWPDNADGDVFRRLEASGFDFTARHVVDYNVDFNSWPPPEEAVAILRREFGNVAIHEPEENFGGYLQLQENGLVSYDRVIAVQASVTSAMAPYGAVCESWGVLQQSGVAE